jgi:hypothetical protein
MRLLGESITLLLNAPEEFSRTKLQLERNRTTGKIGGLEKKVKRR